MNKADKHLKLGKSFTITPTDDKWLSSMGKRFGLSRSEVIAICIDAGRDELALLDAVGLRPERVGALYKCLGTLRSKVEQLLMDGELELSS